jgi:predicted nuclease of predicted toxin-antitoxin system
VFILLDENLLSKKLKKPLLETGHEVRNVDDMGWRGVKDRELLDLVETHAFDVLITADQNLPHQQNLRDRPFRLIILAAKSTRPDVLLPLIIQSCSVLATLLPGSVIFINEAGKISPFLVP